MRKWIALPLVALLAVPISALAEDTAVLKKQLEASLNGMMKAFKNHDIKGVTAIYADNYDGTSQMGEKMTKAKMEAQMKKYMDTTKSIKSSKFVVSDLKVTGNTATGKTTFALDTVMVDADGMMGEKGKTHHMQFDEHTSVTWTKTGGKWLISKETPGTPGKMILDGKPFNPMAPTGAGAAPPKKKQ